MVYESLSFGISTPALYAGQGSTTLHDEAAAANNNDNAKISTPFFISNMFIYLN